MKKYTYRCFLQHCKMFLALILIVLLSSFLSFQIAEFACCLRKCNCLKYLNEEPQFSVKGKYIFVYRVYCLKWSLHRRKNRCVLVLEPFILSRTFIIIIWNKICDKNCLQLKHLLKLNNVYRYNCFRHNL
jgi:hypothetical protein